MTPSIAVLITYYNEGALLTECLESLRRQSAPPDEILVYDDCSPSPAADYIPAGMNVRILREPVNRGACYGRDYLVTVSQSEYIHFHDADDYFGPHWYERVKESCAESAADIILHDVCVMKDGGIVHSSVMALDNLMRHGDLIRYCLCSGVLPIATTVRRTVAQSGRHPVWLRQAQDYYYYARLALTGATYATIPEVLAFKRERAGNQSSNIVEVWTETARAISDLATHAPRQYHVHLSEFAARVGRTLYHLGSPADARNAFRLAEALGPPRLNTFPPLYRAAAKTLGHETAERLGVWYRKILRQPVRQWLGAVGPDGSQIGARKS